MRLYAILLYLSCKTTTFEGLGPPSGAHRGSKVAPEGHQKSKSEIRKGHQGGLEGQRGHNRLGLLVGAMEIDGNRAQQESDRS